MRESKARKIQRAAEIVKQLKKSYPNAKCSLNYSSPHELLIATILSAQCTDHRVNQVTKTIFRKYQSQKEFAYADINELAKEIYSCGYHNQKAKSIQGSSLEIVEEYNGIVPDNMEDLVKLPGVGRKTANCVLSEIYGIPSMVIDTHMVRIMNLLGFTHSKDAKKIEIEIMEIFDKNDWIKLTHMIIDHGRAVCIARRPQCSMCSISNYCPSVTS
ncbi:MAG TPA: endonuclease III [Candidatus Marinimicrobia bacterium]|nr:endonuclease III [Candidatus Neomarinimicrobiota bacterium]HIB52568.1 endonuclease III [Candidatus Neomarinimicrobiota bacterium]HIN96544.1 endonuclease III [Candidatus Neomarinimicrobiota bacterium]